MKKITALTFLFVFSIQAYAQNVFKGKVLNEEKVPLLGIEIHITSLQQQFSLKLKTDKNGTFEFKKNLLNYQLSINQSGYILFELNPIQGDTLSIILKKQPTQLKEVTISGNRPFLEQQIDRTIVNVNGDLKAGINAIDILKKIPGIALKNGEELTVEGKGITLLIDSKPTRLTGNSLINLLEGTATANVGQIEIIYNPSAKYDAAGSGGIINIKTLKRTKPGYDANLSATIGHGWKYPLTNNSVGINYKNEHQNYYASYGFGFGKQYQEVQTNTLQSDINQRILDSAIYKSYYNYNNLRLGADHQINKDDTFGVLFTGYFNNRSPLNLFNTRIFELNDNNLKNNSQTYNQNIAISRGINANLNYKHLISTKNEKEIIFDADAGLFDFNNSNENEITILNLNGSSIPSKQYFSQNGYTKSQIYSIKTDYTQKISKGILESGLKLSNVQIENNFISKFTNGLQLQQDYGSNDFNYKETILAAYINGKLSFGKLSFQLGLRAEQTYTNGYAVTLNERTERQYLNLFPNITSALKLTGKTISLSYSRRVGRPAYNNLNPFAIIENPYQTRKGNPYLNPSYTDNLRLAFTLNGKLTLATSYSFSHDVITDLKTRAELSEITNSFKSNLSTYKNIGFNVSYSNKILKIVQVNYGMNVSNSDYNFIYNLTDERVKQTSVSLSLGNNIQINKTLWAEVFFYGQSKVTYGNQVNLPFSTTSISAGKKIMNGNGNLSLQLNDIFYTGLTRSEANYGNIAYDLKSKYDSRNIRLTFSYRFGNSKIDTKKRNSGSEDEQRRNQ